MLRWLIGGGREPQGLAEKSSVQTIGEEQVQNPYTELLVLKGHQDIVRFLVQIDDCRFASAGDDGIIFLWNAQPGLGLHYWQTGSKSIMFPFYCEGISALVELPKNSVAAAVGKELTYLVNSLFVLEVIFRLIASSDKSEGWSILEVKRLVDHQDNILSLVSVNGKRGFGGVFQLYTSCWDQTLSVSISCSIEFSFQNVYAAVGKGIYVYNLQMKRVIACQRNAHDSSVLHIEMLPNRQLISCSEDGSVRIWELREKQQMPAEPVPTGFFNMWGFGRANKQANQTKKVQENTRMHFLELVGDLIGHSSAVQMFLYFSELGLVTCSADHLIILWKDGERESRLRSLTLFQKLAQNGDL
ncbi:UNVERIFIED_CONTAM: hypothetical protein H355_016914 [Colinus virginianus]|nr:hypothetical protein H355_016914 [Colinus virginianus]